MTNSEKNVLINTLRDLANNPPDYFETKDSDKTKTDKELAIAARTKLLELVNSISVKEI